VFTRRSQRRIGRRRYPFCRSRVNAFSLKQHLESAFLTTPLVSFSHCHCLARASALRHNKESRSFCFREKAASDRITTYCAQLGHCANTRRLTPNKFLSAKPAFGLIYNNTRTLTPFQQNFVGRGSHSVTWGSLSFQGLVGQAFQPVRANISTRAGWKACSTDTRSLE
jgi:hypothetical protein